MSKLRVESFTISLDGFGACPNQDIDNPLGVGGTSLHRWAVSTRTFQRMVFGTDGGSAEGIDEEFAARGFRTSAHGSSAEHVGPIRTWPDEVGGAGGRVPRDHVPVFVDQPSPATSVMEGGTTFHFVTDGIAAALARARETAGERTSASVAASMSSSSIFAID